MERLTCSIKNKTLLALAISTVFTTQSYAAEEVSYFDEMVVWGTSVSSSSESLGAEDMSLKQADHLSDILRDIPGVDVGGTHSVNQRINIRGMGETDLDIRLDGASQHANMFHHIGNLTLNPDIIKSADIQVGNNSVTMGGLGGGVYFETKDANDLLRYDEKFGVRVFGGYATNDSHQGSLTAYGKLSEKIDVMLYGQGVSRDDFKDGEGNETFGSAGAVYNALGKIGFEPSENHRFQLSYDLYRDSGDYSPRPDMSGDANQGLSQSDLIPTDYDRDTITLSYELTGDKHKGKVTVYQSKTEIIRDESVITGRWPLDRKSVNTAENNNTGANVKFQSDVELLSLDNEVIYGVDYIKQKSTSAYGGSTFMNESATTSAAFVENKLYVIDDLSFTAGLRYEDYDRKAETGSHSFDALTWGLASEWDITSDWTLFASARSLFKGPELLETFIKYQDVAHLDDDIKAETGLNTQGGIKYNTDYNEHSFGSSVTIFKTQIDDYIAEAYQASSRSYLIYNSGDVEFTGFEVSGTYGYEMFMSKLSYSRTDNEDNTNGGPVINGAGRSSDMGDSIALTLDYQSLELDTVFGWTSIVVLDETNVQDGAPDKEGYDVHNLYVQWLPSSAENLSITFGIDNVFDEQYVSHASRSGLARTTVTDDYEPGRNYKVSGSYQF